MMWLQNNNELTMSKMSCQLCFPYIGVILCLTLVGYIYYVYIVFFCLQMVQIIVLKVTLIFFFHLLLFLFLWAYLMTVFTREKTVPDEFQVPEDYFKETVPREEKQVLIENLVNGLPILTLTLQGKFRICTKCRKMKPDRTHHCSECQRCILKMDHHCPWITNCASFSNYKYFLLTLVYGVFFTLFCLTSLLPYFLRSYRGHIKERKLYFLVIAMILSGIVSFVLLVLLICHIRLVLTNRTSLEFLRPQFLRYYGQTKFPFHLGKIRNLEQVFGGKWQKWLVPVYTTYGNGVEFPLRAELQREIEVRRS